MKMISPARAIVFVALPLLMIGGSAAAQESYSAGQMWGTQPAGVAVPGAVESSAAHFNQGVIAGQVNAARKGLLVATGTGDSITIQSIGSQSVINQTITGNDISSSIVADQKTRNDADVMNDGTIKFE